MGFIIALCFYIDRLTVDDHIICYDSVNDAEVDQFPAFQLGKMVIVDQIVVIGFDNVLVTVVTVVLRGAFD